jgi:hypothetical protein
MVMVPPSFLMPVSSLMPPQVHQLLGRGEPELHGGKERLAAGERLGARGNEFGRIGHGGGPFECEGVHGV